MLPRPTLLTLPITRQASMSKPTTLRPPRPSINIIPTAPFTPDALSKIRAILSESGKLKPMSLDSSGREIPEEESVKGIKTASVLIALCNVNDVPGVLLEVRGKLRTHSGEIRSVLRVLSLPSHSCAHK